MPKMTRLSRKQYLRLFRYKPCEPPPFRGGVKAKEKARRDWLREEEEYKGRVAERLNKMQLQMDEEGTEGLVGYEILDMGSSSLGSRKSLPAGKIWAHLKSLDEVLAEASPGRPLGETPSVFHYPQYFWKRPTTAEDYEWERLQDEWDELYGRNDFPCDRRKIGDEARASAYVETGLQQWRFRRDAAANESLQETPTSA